MPHGKSGGGKKPSAAQTGGRRNDAPRGGQSPKNSGTDKPKNFKRKSGWAKPKPTAKEQKEIKNACKAIALQAFFFYRSYIHLPGDRKKPMGLQNPRAF